jgi:hypothetical protein
MLLGELYLWKGDYKNAAKFFYSQIVGSGTNETAKKYTDAGYKASYNSEGGKGFNNSFIKMFAAKTFSENSANYFTIIPFADTELYGTTSGLAAVFSPQSEIGGAQVVASPGIQSLAERQVYCFMKDPEDKKETPEYSHFYEYTGDLRIKATTYSQRGEDDNKTEYKNIIGKFNFEEGSLDMDVEFVPGIKTTYLILQRKEHAYLRLAEALVGLEREGYEGAMELAMTILKEGAKSNYRILKNPVYAERVKLDADGDTLYNYIIENKDTVDIVPRMEKYLASCTDSLVYNFTAEVFTGNSGIHSRGSGYSERNEYYALNDTCIARYLGVTEVKDITREDSLNYMADLVLDELALELAWEGTRFTDLIRFSEAMDDNDVLAKRVAGRNELNTVKYRSPLFVVDRTLYDKLNNTTDYWYLPLPDNLVDYEKNK